MSSELYLTYDNLDKLIHYAKTSTEKEVCGLIVGDIISQELGIFRMHDFVPINNVSPNNEIEYIPEPSEYLSVLMSTKHLDPQAKYSIIGVFHTHPKWPPIPSLQDIEMAGIAGIYIIYSNKYNSIKAWFNEGSQDPNITYAIFQGEKKFGPSKLIIE